MRVGQTILIVVLFVGVGARITSLRGEHLRRGRDAGLDRDTLLDTLSRENATAFRFDAAAEVIIDAGQDGQPGRKNADDNANGVVDDPREIGAVGSDDRCLAPSDEGYAEALQDEATVVISRGAMVPAGEAEPVERWFNTQRGWVVVGR